MLGLSRCVLVTWGLWYIGSHTVVALYEAGFYPVILDNCVNSTETVLESLQQIVWSHIPLYQWDIRDAQFLESVFQKHQFEGVFHFAWLKSPVQSQTDPFLYYENNVVGSLVLFRMMERFGCKKIVFSSSANVYHASNVSPIAETGIVGPNNPYGQTKYVCEQILQDLARFQEFSVLALRYFNPIGAHPSWLIGESPRGIPNNLLPFLYDVARGTRECFTLFGTDYETPDGTGIRDYIDVNDLARAHVLGFRLLQDPKERFQVVNVGTGHGVSVKQMISLVEQVCGNSLAVRIADRRPGDLWCVFADVRRASELLWFQTEYSLSDSVQNGWRYVQNQKHKTE